NWSIYLLEHERKRCSRPARAVHAGWGLGKPFCSVRYECLPAIGIDAMLESTGSPAAARRVFAALARVGIDLRPALRRVRDAILHPARQEAAVETADIRREIDTRLAEIAARTADISSRVDAEAGRP